MSINNSITGERIKKALTPKTIAIALVFVAVVSIVFYITLENRDSKEVLIWNISSENNICFTDEQIRLAREYGAENGIDKVVITNRDPEDRYFDAAMSTSAYYNCDIFVMNCEMVQKYIDVGMFKSLSYEGYDEVLRIGDAVLGILIDEDYYLLVNDKTDVDMQIIYGILNILAE